MISRAPFPRARSLFAHAARPAAIAVLGVLILAGCTTTQKSRLDETGPGFEPRNISAAPAWPAEIRRVAVLPTADATGNLPVDFTSSYDAIWLQALQQSQRAEFVAVPRDIYARWTGRAQAPASTSVLPANWVERIRAHTGAEAAVLIDITRSTPYPPLVLGLRTKIVRLDTGEVIWAADEVFDASNPLVMRSARRFARAGLLNRESEALAILQSPAGFATYAFSALAATFPPRVAVGSAPR